MVMSWIEGNEGQVGRAQSTMKAQKKQSSNRKRGKISCDEHWLAILRKGLSIPKRSLMQLQQSLPFFGTSSFLHQEDVIL